MKFKIGKLYRVVKDSFPGCIGCILRYKGLHEEGFHCGKALNIIRDPAKCRDNKNCRVFELAIRNTQPYRLIEHIDMIKFCKKLRKERISDRK